MEQEICRRETTRKITTIFKYVAYACAALAVMAFGATLLVLIVDNAWDALGQFDSSFIIPIVIGIVSALLAFLFFKIEKNVGFLTSYLVLTNKRIYLQVATAKINETESYHLNAISYYRFYQTTAKGKSYFTLTFKTATATAKFIVDEAFYNEFVNAVNATISVAE